MILVVIILTLALCFAVDKGFSAFFRNKAQHKSGLSVHLPKRYGLAGLLLPVLGISALLAGLTEKGILLYGGIVLILVGIALSVYYLSFGVFYDEDSFILASFGKKETLYRFSQIESQLLFQSGRGILIELFLDDGRSVTLQSAMENAYPFLDHAFAAWCRQKGLDPSQCSFHDPANSLWFPTAQ